MGYSGDSTYVDTYKADGSHTEGKNTTFRDGSGGFEGTRTNADGSKTYISTYYHNNGEKVETTEYNSDGTKTTTYYNSGYSSGK